ncbi:MAG: PhnD/SsuA/transferrin family substrate-binding protein [Bermanella sp.]
MRVLSLACLLYLTIIQQVFACDKPITISYGPYVSSMVVDTYFGQFHKNLQASTGCDVEFRIQQDFEQFIEALFRREAALSLVPGPYFNIIKSLGYVAVSSQILAAPRFTYVVAKKETLLFNLNDLKGRTVLAASPYASSGSFFLQALINENLSDQVQIQYGYSYDRMIMDVLKNGTDAAVLIEEYWALVDPRLKTHHLNVVAKLSSNASSEFVILEERQHLATVILDALQASKLKWGPPLKEAVGSNALDQLLRDKLFEFKNSQ